MSDRLLESAHDEEAAGARTGLGIRLADVSKVYPGSSAPAVAGFTMDIPAGELVVFVGPSGCGKTTTMKMINRIIEPTSGSITIGDEDVLSLDPVRLRRRVGYVIQQIGLFPHMTIAQNVGVVPQLLGWSAPRTAERVDELLRTVALDPGVFAHRYPRQLSGGQQQRVGVARALAADPPVMLMDEPFGATDPITRERLQDEFLELQRRLRKTIVFVTHDFAEAVRLGDRIAVLGDHSRIVQYDTPQRVLSAPADEYVASFIGSTAALTGLGLVRVADADLGPASEAPDTTGVGPDTDLRTALDLLVASCAERIAVRDEGRVVGSLGLPAIAAALAARTSANGGA